MLSIESILTVYQALISVTCFALLGIATWNLFRFARIRPTSSAPDLSKQPLISVLVPARNEERAIGACVESLCRQAYDRYEVIVLDDGSTDATPEILAALSQRFPDRLKVVQGSTLPVGWVGKSWACHNLSTHASGEYLLFVDADTVHEPTMLSSALDFAQARSLDFFSMIPTEVMETWGEKLIIPFVHFMYFAYLPNNLITNNPEVSVSAANGQFMFFSREAYQKVGGHVAVQNNLVEDVFLAKACKKAGLKIALVDGTPIVACRMYTDFQTTIDGFSKNFYPATSFKLGTMSLMLAHFVTAFILPVFFLAHALFYGIFDLNWFWLPIGQYVAATAIRLMIALRFGMPILPAFFHPVTAVLVTYIGIRSVVWAYRPSGALWKGRSYVRATTH